TPHLEGAVPPVHLGRSALDKIKIRPPDQRPITKQPQVLEAAPLAQGALEHRGRVAKGRGQIGHGLTLQSKALFQQLLGNATRGFYPWRHHFLRGDLSCPTTTAK